MLERHNRDKRAVERAWRNLDRMLCELGHGQELRARRERLRPHPLGRDRERLPRMCAHGAVLALSGVCPEYAMAFHAMLDAYREAVRGAMARHGPTLVRAWLTGAQRAHWEEAPGVCPVAGSLLEGQPCACYVAGDCERRTLAAADRGEPQVPSKNKLPAWPADPPPPVRPRNLERRPV